MFAKIFLLISLLGKMVNVLFLLCVCFVPSNNNYLGLKNTIYGEPIEVCIVMYNNDIILFKKFLCSFWCLIINSEIYDQLLTVSYDCYELHIYVMSQKYELLNKRIESHVFIQRFKDFFWLNSRFRSIRSRTFFLNT